MHSALVPRWTTHVNKMYNVFEFNQRPWSVRLSVCLLVSSFYSLSSWSSQLWLPLLLCLVAFKVSRSFRCTLGSLVTLPLTIDFSADMTLEFFFYFFYFFESPSIWLWFGLSRIVFEAIVSVHNIIFFWDFFTLSSFDICGISLNMILITLWGGGFASLHEEYPPVITTTTNATCTISLLQLAHGAITSVYLLLQDHSNKLWINYLWWLPIR